jgi:predicted HAD superfamily Cof-like phosphohydrolase
MSKPHIELVKEFTEESKGIVVPDRPRVIDRDGVRFIAKMMMSEIVELLQSHYSGESGYAVAKELLDEDAAEKRALGSRAVVLETDEQRIEAQMDALVDCEYYGLDCAAKHGMNLEPVFQLVHAANMAKRNPTTGQFERRPDGKVIKPPGWQEADLTSEVRRQLRDGSW